MPRLALIVFALALAVGGVRPAAAQPSADVVWDGVPLAEALYTLSERSGLELVFALRLVEGTRVTGRWRRGESPDEALRRLLRGTGVRAERIRTGQYVLIREPINVTVGVEDGPEAFTATLDGRVVDASTGVPLWGAHVWLVDVGLGDVVDESGGFAVPGLPTGEYAVRISHVGYEPVRVNLSVFPESARLPPTIRLAPEAVASTTAQVSAPPVDAGPVPGTIDLAARQPAVLPFALAEADLTATLDWLPGLSRTASGGGPIVIRGADPHRTLTRRDGVPVYQPWHAFGLLSTLHPETLSRVRLHRGAMPASLGGALAVLDTETTDAVGGDTTLSAGLSLLSARALVDVPVGSRAGLHVAARRSTLGLVLGPDERPERGLRVARPLGGLADGPDLGFDDVEVKGTARIGQTGRASVGGSLSRDRYAAGPTVHTWRGQTASARLRGLVDQRTAADVRLYRSQHRADVRTPEPDAPDLRTEITETGLALDVDRFVSLDHDVELGVSVALRQGGRRGEHTERVAYVTDTWTPSDVWTVQPGLRVTNVSTGEQTFLSPRLYAERRSLDGRFRVRAGAGRQVQAVQAVTARFGGRYDATSSLWAIGGSSRSFTRARDTPVLTSWQSGAGVEWAPTDAVAFGVDGYVRRSEGLIEQDGSRPPAGLSSAGFAVHDERAAGLEAAARLDAGPWTVGLSGAVARSDVRVAATPDVPGFAPREAGSWRPARYDRPLSGGVLAERRTDRTTLAVRLDAESGLPLPDGSRAPASLRAGVAAGLGFQALGAQWNVLGQIELRARRAVGPLTGAPFQDDLLVADLDGLPALPLVSLSARW